MPNTEEQRLLTAEGQRPTRNSFRKSTHALGRVVDGLAGAVCGTVGGALMGAGGGLAAGVQGGLTGLAEAPLVITMDSDKGRGSVILGDDSKDKKEGTENFDNMISKLEGLEELMKKVDEIQKKLG